MRTAGKLRVEKVRAQLTNPTLSQNWNIVKFGQNCEIVSTSLSVTMSTSMSATMLTTTMSLTELGARDAYWSKKHMNLVVLDFFSHNFRKNDSQDIWLQRELRLQLKLMSN